MYKGKTMLNLVPELIKKTMYLFAYILLIAPPKAKQLQVDTRINNGELFGRSLLFILISETALRAGFFLIIGFSVEYLIGNSSYEKYHLDYLFLLLMISGLIHIISFYLNTRILINQDKNIGCLIYRIGRNICYAIMPTLLVVVLTLFYQYFQLQELFSGILVHTIFFVSYLIFILLGIQEAILASLSPIDSSQEDS